MDELTNPEIIACLVAVTRELNRIELKYTTGEAVTDEVANRLGEYRLDLSQAESRLSQALEGRRLGNPSLHQLDDYLQYYPQLD